MSGLVVGHLFELFFSELSAAALGAGDHAFNSFVQLRLGDLCGVLPGRHQGGLVEKVGDIRSGKAGGVRGDQGEVDIVCEGLVLGVNLEDRLSALQVGRIDDDLAVKPSRPQERGIQDVRTIGRGQEDNSRGRVKAVHLDKQLVQRLLPFIMTSAKPGAAMTAYRIQLVDEDDTGSLALGLLKEISYP